MLPYKNPLGYKQLRTWSQANEILELTEEFVKTLPPGTPAKSHMDRSARSTVRNIEEGFRRTTTKEYVSFLGFSAGSNEELLGDFTNCIKGGLGGREMALKGEWLCKGEGKMLHSQILSLENKMRTEKTMSRDDMARDYLKRKQEREENFDRWLKGQVKGDKG